jgi:hypothetical protein
MTNFVTNTLQGKKKVKLSLSLIMPYAMKAYSGVDVQTHVFLTSVLVGGGQLHAPAALLPGKDPRNPLDRRFGGPQSRCGRDREVKILDPTGTRTLTPL